MVFANVLANFRKNKSPNLPSIKYTDITNTITGNVLKLNKVLGGDAVLSMISSTNNKVTLNPVNGVVTVTAPVTDTTTIVMVVREQNGIVAVEYPIFINVKSQEIPSAGILLWADRQHAVGMDGDQLGTYVKITGDASKSILDYPVGDTYDSNSVIIVDTVSGTRKYLVSDIIDFLET